MEEKTLSPIFQSNLLSLPIFLHQMYYYTLSGAIYLFPACNTNWQRFHKTFFSKPPHDYLMNFLK